MACGGTLVSAAARRASAQAPPLLSHAMERASAAQILPGDRVVIKVWREPEYSDSVTVDQNGEAVLPSVGSIRLADYTIAVLQDTLRRRFSEYLRNPSIAVRVYRRVGVSGEVRAPGIYFVDVTMTLRELITSAGGITEAGDVNDVAIVREGRRVRVGTWENGGVAADLRSGDQVVVGRRSWLARNTLAAVSTVGLTISVLLSAVQLMRR